MICWRAPLPCVTRCLYSPARRSIRARRPESCGWTATVRWDNHLALPGYNLPSTLAYMVRPSSDAADAAVRMVSRAELCVALFRELTDASHDRRS